MRCSYFSMICTLPAILLTEESFRFCFCCRTSERIPDSGFLQVEYAAKAVESSGYAFTFI